jgi:glucose/arabinose dehydrogenase/cytochrome c551/c552
MDIKGKLFLLITFFCKVFIMIIATCSTSSGQSAVPSFSKEQYIINKGRLLFQQYCTSCHNFKQQGIGPNLSGLTAEVSMDYLYAFIRNPKQIIDEGNERASLLYATYKVLMPAQPQLSTDDIKAIVSFIHTAKKTEKDKTGHPQSGPALDDPIPVKIPKAGLTLQLKEVVTAPFTADKSPLTRINQMFVLNGKGNRVFINDMRGKLYELKDKKLRVAFDLAGQLPSFIHSPGLGSGFGSYAFHPDFNRNGLFYTTHTEKAGTARSDFDYPDSIPVALQWVLSEWKMDSPESAVFSGKRRELFRINMPLPMHGVQQIVFNPLSRPGTPDYGLLYIGIGDGGAAENGYLGLCNSNTQLRSAVLRIDPSGKNSKNGRYGLPLINPYAADPDLNSLGELFARGFRNPNRISWSPDGKMIISDIGLNNIEELNLGKPGADYGWPNREGTFLMNYKGKMNKVYALPDDDKGFTYPVAQYDHDEGNAISAGFVYTGSVLKLRGKYIFGDIVHGRLFYVESGDLKQGLQAPIKEFDIEFNGVNSKFTAITENVKADLRLGIGEDNELYIFTKTDGKIWEVTGCK